MDKIYKTTDAGNSWSLLLYAGETSVIDDFCFVNNNTGFIIARESETYIIRTNDGGNTWQDTTIVIPEYYTFNLIYFTNPDTGFIGGYCSRLYKTTDGGTTWDFIQYSTSLGARTMFFTNPSSGFIGREYGISSTNDGGATWTPENVTDRILSMSIYNSTIGYAVGNNYAGGPNPVIHRTTTGGVRLGLSLDSNITIACGSGATLLPEITYNGIKPLSYNWIPAAGLSNTTVVNPVANPPETTTYTLTVSDGILTVYNTITVTVEALPAPPLCMVTVDTETGKNKIVWEKAQDLSIVSYYIYKESIIAGNYNLLDTVPYDSLSVFIDTSSNPGQQSERYKIAALDTCGNLSEMSELHKTIHLGISPRIPQGYILIWEHYEGFTFNTYVIYGEQAPITSIPYNPSLII
ncbi:MAG: hypothetical protein HY738_23590 [Bacteroidia bacterium]|nr:hypothetical protein [Bacteroidia bacterium]